jgi:hypothetical protein
MREFGGGANLRRREIYPTPNLCGGKPEAGSRAYSFVELRRLAPVLVLIMTVCSLSAPGDCGEARLEFTADETPMQCMMQAPPYIAQWSEEHPGKRVARWRCTFPESDGRKA